MALCKVDPPQSSTSLFCLSSPVSVTVLHFSQSETVFDPSLNGTFSSAVGHPFHLSIRIPYKYNIPDNAGRGGSAGKKRTHDLESGRGRVYHGSNEHPLLLSTFDLFHLTTTCSRQLRWQRRRESMSGFARSSEIHCGIWSTVRNGSSALADARSKIQVTHEVVRVCT